FIIAVVCGAFVPHAALADRSGFGFQTPQQQVSVGEWFTFSPQRAPFSVTLPAMPTEKGKDRKSRVKVNNYGLKALSSEYLVMWATGLPAGSSGRDSLDSFFPVALKQTLEIGAASGLGFQELYEKELVLDGNCGREARMRTWARDG